LTLTAKIDRNTVRTDLCSCRHSFTTTTTTTTMHSSVAY